MRRLRTALTTFRAVGAALVSLLSRRDVVSVQLAPGDPAPDFVLAASDGRTYRLADFRGRTAVVVAWFPKAFTGGCTAQCTSLGSAVNTLRQFDAAVFAASVDTVQTNQAFAESTRIGCPILSDPDKSVARAYGVLGPHGFPRRWTFYIGSDGRILGIDRQVRADTHGADIESALVRLGIPRRPEAGTRSQAGPTARLE